jgi:hypothetical protein
LEELLDIVGESVSEEEKEFLIHFTKLVDDYSEAILNGEKRKQKQLAVKYKKVYR